MYQSFYSPFFPIVIALLKKMSSSPFSISSFLLVTFSFALICETVEAQTNGRIFPQEEKNALKEIADQLGKKDWNFDLNPCDGNTNWTTPISDDKPLYVNNVTCNCSTPDGFCHVQSIILRGQDLPGVLPPSLVKLPYLKQIDLSLNYLSGTIPPKWASIKLEYMTFMLNQLSGPIPKYLGNMTTLLSMNLESNLFNGNVPKELGNMVNLQNLYLGFNNLIGKFPVELNKLTNLIELRLSGNNFTGKLPSFESLKNLQKLEIQASGFEGPVSPNISVLAQMNDLRISDLTGSASEFPPLENMTGLIRLILRNCNISGKIPSYIANMSQLKVLDLSFNRLEGQVPNLEGLDKLEFLYLTSNRLTGPIHNWIKSRNSRYVTDLSYNNFNENSAPPTCRETLNLFRSYNSTKKSELGKCLSSCSKNWYSVHINCGGKSVTIGDTTYEEDEYSAGAAKFFYLKKSWGASNTGYFSEHLMEMNYKVTNVSAIKGDESELYTTARLSALSLTYYGRCLANGNYTVKLHFAEIVIRDNRSFQSLGKRMFDVYIQGERKLEDFNIKAAAEGVDKALTRKFNVVVEDGILEVRFQYAGKGRSALYSRESYGPLISAISFEANFKPSSNHKKVVHIIAGALASSLILILTILFVAWRRSRNRISKEEELRGLDLLTGVFTIRQIKAATNNFDAANKIGEGGFGSVYKGTLLDGRVIAVKQLSSKSKQGNREFVNEIGMISGLQHPNLVRLYGCCAEGNQLLLVYEYLENNSLARALFGPEEHRLKIDWPTRQKICIGIAKGLAFLHEESSLKIVHRDIKATNVLLDKKLNPKISDFGLAKLDDEDKTHISTRVAGTIGYMAPEYALWGCLTYKADVYSFGVVALEIVAGKNNMTYRPNEKFVCLLDWALVLQRQGKLMELVDETLGSDFKNDEALRMINVALLCTNPSPALRPTMSAVASILEDHIDLPEFNLESRFYDDDDHLKFQGLRDKYDEMLSLSQSQTLTHSSNITGRDCSSTSQSA
ncbi:probable LRR receptor-like serine/threonine-protein kinase At1g07650 isoform X3 [Lycium barbarum]|uniref:probable LRR receptor-like serine/threonine-protein kinase At1g07650 isoform X3 n=1 Tax=Lycium barbarum TaxID=112863 RepID=UPI00293E45E8|nr:probable LRR receptor-like serine/threonine-protein kinase At1g07650 isoform X3 [Lycium barbarum]